MMKLDHLAIPVSDVARSRDWYVSQLGLAVEFEVAERGLVALQDSEEFSIFLEEAAAPDRLGRCALWFQVEDVEAIFAAWSARGVAFSHGPQKTHWGYGAELIDPDGYRIRLWDERSMKEK